MARRARTAYLVAGAGLALLMGGCGGSGKPAPTGTAPTTQTSTGAAQDDAGTADDTDDTTGTGDPADPGAATTLIPSPTDEDSTVTDGPSDRIYPRQGALPTGPVPQGITERPEVQDALAAEAERLGVDADQVGVAGFAEVTWSDGSLGCPQEGMMYTQALVPGYQLVLEVDGALASYHASKDGPFSYCASPVPPVPGYGIETSDS